MAGTRPDKSPLPFLAAQMRAAAGRSEAVLTTMIKQALSFLREEKTGPDRARHASELAFTLAEVLESCRDAATVKYALKTMLGLGAAGEVLAFSFVGKKISSPDELGHALGRLKPKEQLVVLNRFFLAPRAAEPRVLETAAERVKEIAGQDPEDVLLFLEQLADQDREPAYPLQWELLRGQFAVWLEELLKLDLGPEQVEYLVRTIGLLHSPDLAEALSEVVGEDDKAAVMAVRAAVRAGAVSREGPEKVVRGFLKHEDAAVRREAAAGLIRLGSDVATRALSLLMRRRPKERDGLLPLALTLWGGEFRELTKLLPDETRTVDLWRLACLVAEHDNARFSFAVRELAEGGGSAVQSVLAAFQKLAERHESAGPGPAYKPPKFERRPPAKEEDGLFGKVRRRVLEMSGKEGEESGDEAGALRDLAPGGELGRVSVRNADLAGIELENNTFEKTSFNSLGLGAAAMSGCSFESCRLVGVDFRDAEIETDTFTDCVFEHCVFAGAYLDSATFTRCTFKACYFGAATLSGPRITACLFMECDFWGVRFTRAKVTSCSLTASSFAWATLSNSVFRGVAWRDCVFDRTFFDRSDLCGSSSRAGVFSGSRFHQTSFDDPEFLAAGRQALDANMLSNRSKHTAMPSAMNGAAVARLLDRWFFERDASRREEALLAQNRRRMLWAISKWGGRAAEFVKLLPLLLETEAPVPGGGAEAPACRLPGYEPDYDTLRLAEKYLGGESRTALAKKESICVEGLYSIGSVGTIAQTHTSDLDLWLCYEPGAIDEQRLEAVKARIADIEAWADKEFGLEVHFFVMDLQSVRDNNFGFSDKESAGSTQAKLLKEEFYRTVALLAGKKPAWWCVPPKSTAEQYFSALHKLGRSPDFRDDCLIDLGHLDEVAKEEFFGASLWQIVKALKRPFKSVLKFAVLDRYFASGETGVLFCDRIKENLFSGARDLWDVDAYAVLFREVYEFYRRAGNEEAMDLMRRAFRQKTRFNLQGRTTGRPIEMTGASFMEYFHPVSDSRVERDIAPTVGAVKAAEEGSSFTDMVATGRKVSRFMFSTYDSVQDKLAAEKLEAQVSREDMTKLGRKIFAGFKQKPGKVMLVPFVDPPQGLYSALDIQCLGKPGAKSVWIVRGMRNEAGQEGKGVFEEVGRDHHPVSLAAWLTANEIYDPKLHVQGGNLQKPISLPDLTDLLEALDAFFPHADTFNTDIEENLNDERAVKVFTVVNMMTIREEKAIRDAQVIYSTNWGELFCLTNPGGLHLLEGDPMDFVRANVPHASGYGVQAEFHIPRKARCPRVHSA